MQHRVDPFRLTFHGGTHCTVKRWQMADGDGLGLLPENRPISGRKGLVGRIGGFYVAVLLFFFTVWVDLLHTCAPPWLFAHHPLTPSINGSLCFTDPGQTPTGRPLACLLLQALSATRIAIISFALSWLIFVQKVFPHWWPSFIMSVACPRPIRAPPLNALMS